MRGGDDWQGAAAGRSRSLGPRVTHEEEMGPEHEDDGVSASLGVDADLPADAESGPRGDVAVGAADVVSLFAEPPTMDDLSAWVRALQALQDDADRLLRTLREVTRAERTKTSDDTLRKAYQGLRRLALKREDARRAAGTLADTLQEELQRRAKERRRDLLQALREGAEAANLRFERLADDPLEVRLGPFEVSIPEEGSALVRLGREAIEAVNADAPAILRKCTTLSVKMREERIDAETFFVMLIRAWRMVLAATSGDEARIDLVDTLLPLGLLSASPAQWRKTKEVEPMERWRLAYQLYRLQREGRLTHQGWRLELGAATIAATRDPRNVVYILRGDGQGQFYASLRFTRVATGATPPSPGPAALDAPTPTAGAAGGQAELDALLADLPMDEDEEP